MTQDFAKIRPEPLLEKKPAQPPPAWSLMITGILVGITIGIFACVLFYLSGKVPQLPGTQSVSEAAIEAPDERKIEEEFNNSAPVNFEFYTELPRYEVQTNATPVDLVSEKLTGAMMLQTGAFQQREAAEQEMQRQLTLGLNFIIKSGELLGRTLFLVQTGPYITSSELNEAREVLRRNNIPSLTIQLQ